MALVHRPHRRGAAQARIELHPAELGGVTIQLQVAHDGLRAHIAADRPEALPLLQRAAADLQRSLEARGIDLSGLDFGLAPDAEAGASHDQGRAQGRENPFGGPGRLGSEDEADAVDAVTTTTRSVELPAGALVDVRA
jgi:flagellar hook-length control protein FliK